MKTLADVLEPLALPVISVLGNQTTTASGSTR
jgi:hypothetical protein